MPDDHRVDTVKRLLLEHVKSPSLRHIKDPYVIIRLAHDIVKRLDRGNSMWTKWNGPREQLAKAAVPCWIPAADLRDHLNLMEGPPLTTSDVAQRLRAFEEESYTEFARDEHQASCLTIYEAEKTSGTECPQSLACYATTSNRKKSGNGWSLMHVSKQRGSKSGLSLSKRSFRERTASGHRSARTRMLTAGSMAASIAFHQRPTIGSTLSAM